MQCQKCGTDNNDTFKFCVKCGTALREIEAGAQQEGADAGASESGEPAGTEATVDLLRVQQLTLRDRRVTVFIDGREVDSIELGQSKVYTVEPGIHTIQVHAPDEHEYQSKCLQPWSETLGLNAAEGSRTLLKCGFSAGSQLWLMTPTQSRGPPWQRQ